VLYISEKKSGRTSEARKNKKQLLEAPLEVSVHTSAYACSRATLYSSGTYAKERGQVGDAAGRVRQFRTRLVKEWTRHASPESIEKLKNDLQTLIAEVAPRFQRSQNVNKAKVKKLLNDIEESLQQDFRVTPSAKSSQLFAVEQNLESRRREANRKHSFRTRDGGALESMLIEWESSFDGFASQLRGLKVHLKTRPAFGGRRWSTEEQLKDRESLREQLTLTFEQFSEMRARPFRTFAAKMLEVKDELSAAIDSGQRSAVTRVLIKLDLICRFQKAQAGLERIKRLTVKESGVTMEDLVAVGDVLAGSLPETPTFGKNMYRDVFKEYDALRLVVNKIRERLNEYAAKPLSLSEREAMAERLRNHTKTLDLENALGAIRQ
jgi:hypothetical protein